MINAGNLSTMFRRSACESSSYVTAGEGAVVDDSDVWGGRNEKVCGDETQKEFLRRTTVHIISPPNPAQLEMRILANHGPDKRFAFLRGRLLRV